MKSTDCTAKVIGTETREGGETYFCVSTLLWLHEEDIELADKALEWMNELGVCPEMDFADFLMSCVTNEIHRLTEARTGQKFVLRMDRKPN